MNVRRITALLAMLGWSGMAAAQFTVDGSNAAPDAYVSTANNTNTNFSFGTSAKSETLLAGADLTDLYLFVEGSLNNTNYGVVLIDSDASTATGFTVHPDGATGTSNALEYFDAFPDGGGYDLTISFRAGGGGDPINFSATIISYTAAGAILDEVTTGNSAGNPGVVSATIRGEEGQLAGGLVQGDGPNDGIEMSIPRRWLLDASGTGSLRVMCINGNGTLSTFSDSCIPMMGTSGSFNPTTPGDEGRLAGLNAPAWAWAAIMVPIELTGFVLK